MKLTKLMLTALAGCAVVSSVRAADVTLHLYGSTAYRRASFEAIGNLYNGGATNIEYATASAILTTTTTGPTSPAFAASNILWQGTIGVGSLAGKNVNIYCNWSGSVSGIESVASDPAQTVTVFLPVPPDTTFTHHSSSTVDVAMGDCFQDVTPVNANVNGFDAVNEANVAVLEFIWGKGTGSPAGLTNIEPWTADSILTLGKIPMSQFTGNSSDVTNTIYVTGRNDDSGTRIITETDSHYNVGDPVIQYLTTANTYVYYGAGNNIVPGDGDGAISGGTVASALGAARTPPIVITDQHGAKTTNSNAYLIGYVAVTDAMGSATFTGGEGSNTLSTVSGSPTVPVAQWLSYNGVPFSEAAIREGSYTMFGFEHCDFNNNASTTVQNFAADYRTKLAAEAGASYIPGTMQLGDMNITRQDDGGPVTHN
jgi:hypothetical protein